MKWLRRLAIAMGLSLVAAVGVATYVWWQMHREPDDFANAPAMDAAEAERVLREIGKTPPAPVTEEWSTKGGWGRKRPPSPAAAPRPYRVALTDRQVAALVVTHVARAAGGQVGDIRVVVREHDLFAAGRLQGTAFSGSVVSMTGVPSARHGRLCLALGEPRVGGQRIPEDLLQELGAQAGQKMPRMLCLAPRAIGLPGPVRSARISEGKVVVEGER